MYQRKRNRKIWTEDEDELLQATVATHGNKWVKVAQLMSNNRNASQCSQRWKKLSCSKAQTRWSLEEDFTLLTHKLKDPRLLQLLPNRTMKQIRERFINVLDPTINRDKFSEEEDALIWQYSQEFGRRWTQISELLPGRPENMIKNRFYSYILEEYGQEEKAYFVAYKNGKSSYKKKIQKRQLKQKKQQQLCQSESTEIFDQHQTPTYLSFVRMNILKKVNNIHSMCCDDLNQNKNQIFLYR